MIYLKSLSTSTTNVVYLNLMDRVPSDALIPIPTWGWLMEFTNDFTGKSYVVLQILGLSVNYIKGTNTVAIPIVASKSALSNPIIQQINLPDMGYYSYKIYLQDKKLNTEVSLMVNPILVQTGKALVYDDSPEQKYAAAPDGSPYNFIHVP
jgi:hypothetical protein